MSDPFLGEIRLVGFNFAPNGWATCDGQILSIQQYSALYSLLGTTYGGNGLTNFALPDLRSKVPVHQGQGNGLSPYVMGEQTGTETVTLLNNQMPAHTHFVNSSTAPGTQASPANAIWAEGPGNRSTPSPSQYSPGSAANATMAPTALQSSGGNQAHYNIQPLLVLNFIIALQGIYPSRS